MDIHDMIHMTIKNDHSYSTSQLFGAAMPSRILHLAALHCRRHRVERLGARAVRHQHGIAQAAADGAAPGVKDGKSRDL